MFSTTCGYPSYGGGRLTVENALYAGFNSYQLMRPPATAERVTKRVTILRIVNSIDWGLTASRTL